MLGNIEIPAMGEALAANGTSAGVITVADTTPYYPGAFAWLSNDTKQQKVVIVSILTSTTMNVRFVADVIADSSNLMYGSKSDASAFTTLTNSRINMPRQLVQVVQPQVTKFTPP